MELKISTLVSVRSASKLLRYLLRSATKPKEGKPPLVDSSNSSAHKRGKLASSVSKSVGVLDLSDKKPVKPPIRLSVSSKLTASPAPRTIGDALYALRCSLNASSNQLADWNQNLVNPCTWSKAICDNNNNVETV
ncbi:uncharacterized protein Fot_41269 [Forsythia ovata]|uniref:Leucine-rich repeat-containing N-terminal plant-type domain-containing protein n=1 Tax=Forsythia ovata TaxID=205694 RepID=A0ABD1RHS2_9LAMI